MAQYAFNARQRPKSLDTLEQPLVETLAPLSDSQQSSSLDSPISQRSQMRPSSSGPEVSQGNLHETKTPSTSFSNGSSQERPSVGSPIDEQISLDDGGIGMQESSSSDDTATAKRLENPGHHTSAPKRMANGEVKSPEWALPNSPAGSSQYRHSRNSSTTSRGSQIGEISSQMKTRLSYAMVKVKNGWQSHNISELEQLASNTSSPLSPDPEQRRLHTSQVAKIPHAGNPQHLQSPVRTPLVPRYRISSPQQPTNNSAPGVYPKRNLDYQTPSSQSGASYESFWQEHDGRGFAPGAVQGQSSSHGVPTLGPPADILSRNSRRANTTILQPPALRTHNLNDSDHHLVPQTPSPKKPSKMRTPSQQAAVEKDAVESLLFMSSPGNSGYHPPIKSARTPSSSSFASHSSQALYPRNLESGNGSAAISFPGDQRLPSAVLKRPLRDADIDRMLDEMPDTSSSDEEDPQRRDPFQKQFTR